ncbi:hypothetical protein FRC02_005825 [Tulasnella sp. 418]|nr:hypothetical protein FRC02_005825 [Tulasnella sp. 418]
MTADSADQPDQIHVEHHELATIRERSNAPSPGHTGIATPISDEGEKRYIEEKHIPHGRRNSKSVPVDYFDREGMHALTRTLSRMSQDRTSIDKRAGQTYGISGDQSRAQNSEESTMVGDKPGFDLEKVLQDIMAAHDQDDIPQRNLGVWFRDLRVVGAGATGKFQKTLTSMLGSILSDINELRHPPLKNILHGFEGTVKPGEMLLVLGRPGSGCSTFLKTLANQRRGYHSIEGSIAYDGLSSEEIAKHHRGDVGYVPEDDIHFPTLTVRQTLKVAAATRTPRMRPAGISREDYEDKFIEIIATVFGLRHAYNTLVGNEAVRGVSGGERKRVSISEVMALRTRLACWDNSTRGLDSSTALEFTRALRIATDIAKMTTIVSIYQASENLYELFDKVCVIDAGKMIYFGPADKARQYFIDIGFEPANRQTTADFLVAVTDSSARHIRPGYENRAPRTTDELVKAFQASDLGQANRQAVTDYAEQIAQDHQRKPLYIQSAATEKAKRVSPKSSYVISIPMQIRLIMRRRFQVLKGDALAQGIQLFSFVIQAVIMGSVFLRMKNTSDSFFSRGGVLFFAVLFGALSSMAEIASLYSQRPIVARHERAAMYHPFVESLALTVVDIPITVIIQTTFCIILYFMTNLHLGAGYFFIFWLNVILLTLAMKSYFRALSATFASEAAAQAVAGLSTITLVLYTGYVITRPTMIGALKWLTYIDPIRYSFEALMVNEFHGVEFECTQYIPAGPDYENINSQYKACTTIGSVPGSPTINGDRFIKLAYDYSHGNLWRNFGIIIAFFIGFLVWYLFATEIAGTTDTSGVTQLVFKPGADIEDANNSGGRDEEKGKPENSRDGAKTNSGTDVDDAAIVPNTAVFSWQHLNYDITLSDGGGRRLLDDVSGFVVPGKLTALMGESGAGKTTLLNVLAGRVKTGVISGDKFVDGKPLPIDFQRQTGFVEQMDVHLSTSTVREALIFSAKLRQPSTVPMHEKEAYVDEVVRLCGLKAYEHAIVGQVGEGLNVEQRKRLTIAVELVAKPELLLFLDEPTSGLDSGSAWAIMMLLKKLAAHGQAILCTIHQPSSELFQMFDRLLLLKKGGQTCYFGDLGPRATILISYFERNGGRPCQERENPAEYMLEVIGAGATATSSIDWHSAWINSAESKAIQEDLQRIHATGRAKPDNGTVHPNEFASGYLTQVRLLLVRAFQNYNRDPTYIMSKMVINIIGGLIMGFTFFDADNSIQGSQNKLFSVFLGTILCVPLCNQLQVAFINFRNIYEIREGPSKMYHWIPMTLTSLLVELPFNILGSFFFFVCQYWTVGFATASSRIGYHYFMFGIILPLYYTSIAQAVAAMAPNAMIANLLFSFVFSFVLIFNGTLQPFSQLIKFWHWMYHLSPFTYLIEGLLTNAIGLTPLTCMPQEFSTIQPPPGMTCAQYLEPFAQVAGGYLGNGEATGNCLYCPQRSTDIYLASLNMFYSHRWRNAGFMVAYIIFNIAATFVFTYLFRIQTGSIFDLFRKSKQKKA